MRILYLIKAEQIGGAEVQLLDIIKYFKDKFEKIIVGTFGNDFIDRIDKYNIDSYKLFRGNIFRVFKKNNSQLVGLISKEKIEAIHYFHRIFLPVIWLIKIRFPKIKIIYSATSVFKDIRGFLIIADYYLAVSEAVRSNLINFYQRNDQKTYKINHGIKLISYSFENINYFHKPEQTLMLGYAGRLEKSKGIKYLLYLIRNLQNYNIELQIKGNGSQKNELKELVQKLNISSHVKFLNWEDNLIEFLKQIDVFILPSVEHEGFGLVLLEAMASGKIVIASNIGGIQEIVKHNVNGFLADPGNIESLTDLVKEIYTKKIDLEKLLSGIKSSISKFNLDLVMKEYENFYKRIFQQFPAKRPTL